MNKRIVIIGNGVVQKELGETIDKFDIVVRFKKFETKGHEKFIGTKTDVIAWNLGHLIREDIDYCKKKLDNKRGIILAHRPWKRHGKSNKLSKKRAYSVKKYRKEYGRNFVFISPEETRRIYKKYSHHFSNYKKYHMSTGLFFILYFLHQKKVTPIYITGFDFFQTGHQYDTSHQHSLSHSSEIEKKIIENLAKKGKIIFL